MLLPQKKKPGDPVLSSDWNLLVDAIAARTPRSGSGLELIASSGGFAYSRPGPGASQSQQLPPFAVIGIEKAASSYLVTVKEGWVIERRPETGDTPTVKFHMPKAGATALDTIPRPQVAMAIGDTLWCKVQTDISGAITGDPEVIAAAADQNGNHYYPEDPEGSGGAGDYFIKLFKLENDGGSPRVKVYQQSDIEHWAQLWRGINVGAGSHVFKRHDEAQNRYEFRTLRGEGAVSVVQADTEIIISMAGGKNANHIIEEVSYASSGGGGTLTRTTGGDLTLYIRGGLYVGDQYDFPGGPPPAVPEGAPIKEHRSTRVTGT